LTFPHSLLGYNSYTSAFFLKSSQFAPIMSGTTNGANSNTGPALCSVDEFTSQTYDYVVVGGGTAGLCVAARLTENPDVKVAVIEAGANRMDDKQISTPSLYPTLIGREKYDWCMTSVPQVS
jgi:hypothetical protein